MMDITVRDADLQDAARLLEIYSYYVESTAITFEYDVPSVDEFRSRMARTMEKYPYLVIEAGGINESSPQQAAGYHPSTS